MKLGYEAGHRSEPNRRTPKPRRALEVAAKRGMRDRGEKSDGCWWERGSTWCWESVGMPSEAIQVSRDTSPVETESLSPACVEKSWQSKEENWALPTSGNTSTCSGLPHSCNPRRNPRQDAERRAKLSASFLLILSALILCCFEPVGTEEPSTMTVVSLSPSSGYASGGYLITVYGQGFIANGSVTYHGALSCNPGRSIVMRDSNMSMFHRSCIYHVRVLLPAFFCGLIITCPLVFRASELNPSLIHLH